MFPQVTTVGALQKELQGCDGQVPAPGSKTLEALKRDNTQWSKVNTQVEADDKLYFFVLEVLHNCYYFFFLLRSAAHPDPLHPQFTCISWCVNTADILRKDRTVSDSINQGNTHITHNPTLKSQFELTEMNSVGAWGSESVSTLYK